MSQFNELFNKIISECHLILQNGKYDKAGEIPRPNRMKTPENYYGSTGQNAKYYELYIQDEAEAVFQDKYGTEKGTKMWQNIIGIGNAMWKACDQILGERHSMQSDIEDWMRKNEEIEKQCTDYKTWTDQDLYHGSYIVDWVWWILINKISGKHFTNSYINSCKPTFLGVLNIAPVTTEVLLKLAQINFAEESEEITKPIQQPINTQPEIDVHDTTNIIQNQQPVINTTFELNGNKDHDRIIGILQKSLIDKSQPISLDNINKDHAIQLAINMNTKITGEEKRARRQQACLDLGLNWLADYFKPVQF